MAEAKSFADVFHCMLTSWKTFLSFLLLILCVASLGFLGFVIMNKYSGATIKAISFSATGPKVIFVTESSSGTKEYLLVVHPQGWQNTGIHIEEGNKISVKADGRVNIDGGGLFRTVIARKDLEDKIKKDRHLDDKSADQKQTPEYYFSDEDKKKTMVLRPWVDPSGFASNTADEQIMQLTFGNRAERLELKGANLGCLIGRIGESSASSPPFKIGKALPDTTIQTTGDLWLNVNDVKNLQSDLPQQMFYQDNLGCFWVVVTVNLK